MNIIWPQVLFLMFNISQITLVATATLDGYYYVNKDDPSLGGCTDDQAEWLGQAYEEAVVMIEGAIDATRCVQRRRDLSNPGESQRWDKIFIELHQMFDVHVHQLGTILDRAQKAPLGEVIGKTHKS